MKEYLQKHKYHFIVLFVLILITIISGYQSYKIPNSKFQITDNQKTIGNNTIVQLNNTTTTNNNNSIIQLDNKPITNYQLQATTTSTVLEIMQQASADSRTPFLFKTKTYPGLGEFVEEINGLKNNPQTGEYWIYYLNGQNAKIGISNQMVKPNDLIEWKFGKTNF